MKRIFAFVLTLTLSLALVVTAQAQDNFAIGGMYDFAGLMSEADQQALDALAREITARYGIGVYGYLLEDYREYGSSIEDAADALYNTMPEEEVLMLVLSMAERDYLLFAYGEQTQYTFNDGGMDYLEDYFLDDFAIDDWQAGFEDYFSWTAEYIEAANGGNPYSDDNIPIGTEEKLTTVAIVLVIALVIAGGYILILNMKMKSVHRAVDAGIYLAGSLHLTRRSDVFTHKTVTRQKIEQPKSTTRSGGGVRISSGGGRGRGGKF